MVVLSRHRLPHPYRAALTLLWITPPVLLTIVLALHLHDQPARLLALIDPRYWLPLAFTLIPAAYLWREGIDVLHDGVRARMHVPHTYAYETLGSWSADTRTGILTVRDRDRRTVFETHTAHLTNVDRLVQALSEHVTEHL